MASAEARERYSRKTEAADLQRAFTVLDSKGDGKIDAAELGSLFKRLGHKFTRVQAEIDSIIWEADTDCDRCLTWKEFQEMYDRCRNDQTGYEPRRLFNVVLFLMNDKDSKGTVSVEETMQILYLRYGRQLLDAQLEEIFGTSDLNSGKALTLSQFMHSLHTSQVRQLNSRVTAKTYQVPPPVPKKQVAS